MSVAQGTACAKYYDTCHNSINPVRMGGTTELGVNNGMAALA